MLRPDPMPTTPRAPTRLSTVQRATDATPACELSSRQVLREPRAAFKGWERRSLNRSPRAASDTVLTQGGRMRAAQQLLGAIWTPESDRTRQTGSTPNIFWWVSMQR